MMLAPAASWNRVSEAFPQALSAIEGAQLATGEIPNYRKLANGTWEYLFSPLISAYVADALAMFDPLSCQFDPFLVEQAGGRWRVELSSGAARIRRRIRRFLAWQQSADGAWRFLGRGSSLPPDPDTTACCAWVLLDRIGANREGASDRLGPACLRLCEPDQVQDPVAGINIFRLVALSCGDGEALAAQLLRRCGEPGGPAPVPVSVSYVLGTAWRQCGLPGFEPLKPSFVNALIRSQTSEGAFGGALATAMSLNALLDFGYTGPETESAARWLLDHLDSSAQFTEEFCRPLCGSPVFTRAVAIAALSRASL